MLDPGLEQVGLSVLVTGVNSLVPGGKSEVEKAYSTSVKFLQDKPLVKNYNNRCLALAMLIATIIFTMLHVLGRIE